MPRYRIRYEEPSSGGALTNLVLGALAGFAVGVLVAQKSGGIAGIAAGVKRRLSELTEEESTDEPAARAAHDSEFDEALDEEELDDEELGEDDELAEDDQLAIEVELGGGGAVELEEEVLEAFQADPTLRERAIDISAVGEAVIEISGWVDSEAESRLAAAVAGQIPGVESVVNRLAVGNADGVAEAPVERKDSRGKKKPRADQAEIEEQEGTP